MINDGQNLLSLESLQRLPDETQNRLQMIPKLLDQSYDQEDHELDNKRLDIESSVDIQSYSLQEEASTPDVNYSSMDQIISVSNIPSLRSLYRSRTILQRDQSYAPNVSHNQLMSFIHHDLTRLAVDAIVNNAPTDWKMSSGTNTLLHSTIFKAGGPGLVQEAKSKANIEIGQVELTHGHDLPSSWIIHAAGPRYTGSKGYGQFKVLSSCYQNTLKLAVSCGIKTIAFPCLGTGGCGFPPRVAARIALQEIREFLDSHPEHGLERIVICVKTDFDEKAYMDFFPVFFPPTHGDLDRARTASLSVNGGELATQVQESCAQIQKAVTGLRKEFGAIGPSMETNYLEPLRAINSSLQSISNSLLGPPEKMRNSDDITLLCSVIIAICGTITEMTELAKNTATTKHACRRIWTEKNNDLREKHGSDLAVYLHYIRGFADLGDNVDIKWFERKGRPMRQLLEKYRAKEEGRKSEGDRSPLYEGLDAGQDQQEGVSSRRRDIVSLQQIPSVAKLFQLGDLEAKPTLAHPSATFNQTVCLVREDIMKLEVDIMVNSTDTSFLGMGVLDRSVFKKGGPELMEEVKKFGMCNEGDVKVTPGYLLPAKHILHAIPPDQFGKSNKDVLRNIYREILHTAVLMEANSVAIPSIGTGRLNYPRRDCASLAMEEVKRFLESAEPNNSPKKIIFVVYSSNDEFIYKSLLPVYFPPPHHNAYAPLQLSEQALEPQGGPSSSKSALTDPVSLLASLSGAHHVVQLGNQPDISRLLNNDEEEALIKFESHAQSCAECKDIWGLYERQQTLCTGGYRLAQSVVHYLQMSSDEEVYSSGARDGKRDKVNIPADMFPLSLLLLHTVEKSMRDGEQGNPFVASLPLPTRILAYLTDDLKTRPGSYIGQQTKEIAAALETDMEDVTLALGRLAKYGAVHNTLDKEMWVISQDVNDHPVWVGERSTESTGSKLDPALAEKLMKWTDSSRTPPTAHELDPNLPLPNESVSVAPQDVEELSENEHGRS